MATNVAHLLSERVAVSLPLWLSSYPFQSVTLSARLAREPAGWLDGDRPELRRADIHQNGAQKWTRVHRFREQGCSNFNEPNELVNRTEPKQARLGLDKQAQSGLATSTRLAAECTRAKTETDSADRTVQFRPSVWPTKPTNLACVYIPIERQPTGE